jgi:DNA-binding NtrC family response regulator
MARILVVDDEQTWLDLTRERLTEMGHEVVTSEDFFSIYREIREEPLHLVILDIVMPLNGRSILWFIQKHRPALPVIIHSAYGGYRRYPEFRSATAFVVKSPDLAGLEKEVEVVLPKRPD